MKHISASVLLSLALLSLPTLTTVETSRPSSSVTAVEAYATNADTPFTSECFEAEPDTETLTPASSSSSLRHSASDLESTRRQVKCHKCVPNVGGCRDDSETCVGDYCLDYLFSDNTALRGCYSYIAGGEVEDFGGVDCSGHNDGDGMTSYCACRDKDFCLGGFKRMSETTGNVSCEGKYNEIYCRGNQCLYGASTGCITYGKHSRLFDYYDLVIPAPGVNGCQQMSGYGEKCTCSTPFCNKDRHDPYQLVKSKANQTGEVTCFVDNNTGSGHCNGSACYLASLEDGTSFQFGCLTFAKQNFTNDLIICTQINVYSLISANRRVTRMCVCAEDFCNKDIGTAIASVRRYLGITTPAPTTSASTPVITASTLTQPSSLATTFTSTVEVATTTEFQSGNTTVTVTSTVEIPTTTGPVSRNTTKDLHWLDKKNVTEDSADSIASHLSTIIQGKNLSSIDIGLTGDILHKFINLRYVEKDVVQKIVSSVSDVMGQKPDVIEKAKLDSNVGEKLLSTLDLLTRTIVLPQNASFLLHKGPNLDSYYRQCSCQDCSRQNVGYIVQNRILTLSPDASASDLDEKYTSGFLRLTLPECDKGTDEASIRYSFRLMKKNVLYNTKEVRDQQCSNYVTPQSTVLTGYVAHGTIGNPVIHYGMKHEYVHLLHRQWHCAYWDVNGSSWTTSNVIQSGRSELYTQCHANHLTDFSVLVNIQEKDSCVCDKILSVLSTVALSVSVISGVVLLAFVIYSNFIAAREIRRRLGRTAAAFTGDKPIQLCVLVSTSLIFMLVFLLFSSKDQFNLSDSSCHATAALLYWLCLSSFCNASLRGLYFHRKFVSVLPSQSWFGYPYFNTIGSAVAICVPGIITGVIYWSRPSLFQRGDSFCWIRPELVMYGLIIPSTAMLLMNIAIFALIARSVYNSVFKQHENRSASATEKKKKSTLLASTLLMVVLDFPWASDISKRLPYIEISALAIMMKASATSMIKASASCNDDYIHYLSS